LKNKKNKGSYKENLLGFFSKSPGLTIIVANVALNQLNHRIQMNSSNQKTSKKGNLISFFRESPKLIILHCNTSYDQIKGKMKRNLSAKHQFLKFFNDFPKKILNTSSKFSHQFKVFFFYIL